MADQLVTVALRAAAQTIESELDSELEPRGSVDQSTVVQSTGNQNPQYSRQKFTLYKTLQQQQQLICNFKTQQEVICNLREQQK